MARDIPIVERRYENELAPARTLDMTRALISERSGAAAGSRPTVIGTYGEDVAVRTAANYVGIWADARHEVIYFVTTRGADGAPSTARRATCSRSPPRPGPRASRRLLVAQPPLSF